MPKQKIGLVIDELSDIPESIVKENNISVVKFKLDFQDLAELPGNIYEKVRQAERLGIKSTIKTSQPSINDFLSAFNEKLKEFEEVICITFSSKMSGAYNSAFQAKKFLGSELQNRVHVFDSLNASGSEGLVILRAASLMKKNLDAGKIIETLKQEFRNIKLTGIYKSPKWLEASGRLPKFVPKGMNQAEKMGIRPIIGLVGGRMMVIGIKRNIKDLSSALFENFEKSTRKTREAGKPITVAITHADNPVEANKLKEMVIGLGNVGVAFVNLTCFPIGGHVGPDALILSWNQ